MIKMPKGMTRQYLGGRKKLIDGNDPSRTSAKPNKKLPPLPSGISDTNIMQPQQEPILLAQNGIANDDVMEETECKRNGLDVLKQGNKNATTKHKTSNKRRSSNKFPSTHTNSASSSALKRVSTRPKLVDVEQTEGQSKPKPRKKITVKSKPLDKQQQELDPGDGVDLGNSEENIPKPALNSPPKPQWTHIVKKSQIHKQRNKLRPSKKKELPKRRKSDYIIENTWLPREPTADSTTSQKVSTRKLKSNSKALKGQKGKESSSVCSATATEATDDMDVDDIFMSENPITAERVTFEYTVRERSRAEDESNNRNIPKQKGDGGKSKIPVTDLGTQATKVCPLNSSPKPNHGSKLSYSPKLHSRDRETTHVNQINVADFAKLNVQISKPIETPQTNLNITDYQYRVSKVRFKGASNSVPNYNDRQENMKKTVAQNDDLLENVSRTTSRKDKNSIQVSKIEPLSPSKAAFLLPSTMPHRNKFMDMLIGDARSEQMSSTRTTPDSSFPRLKYGSPTPLQKPFNSYEEEMTGEISIAVPKLPHLNSSSRVAKPPSITRSGHSSGRGGTNGSKEVNSGGRGGDGTSGAAGDNENKADSGSGDYTDTSPPTEEEPIVIVTNENGEDVNKVREADVARDGWESGYQSMTPRLSIDSRSHALTPGSALHLDIPSEHRSLTPFSTITTSTYIDHSRPSSTLLDVPHFIGETSETQSRKASLETRSSVGKLPAIYSRNDDYESTDERILDFTPLPVQSIRNSDGEMSD